MLIEQLQRVWHDEIPISKGMGIRIESFTDDTLIARAALAPNINVHGTAFAGSLYAIAALTGWGATWLQLEQRALSASIVIAAGAIDYDKPIADDIVARCRFDAASHATAWTELARNGKCRFPLECELGANDVVAARFRGDYAVRLKAATSAPASA